MIKSKLITQIFEIEVSNQHLTKCFFLYQAYFMELGLNIKKLLQIISEHSVKSHNMEFIDDSFLMDLRIACEGNPTKTLEENLPEARQKNPQLPEDYQIPFPQDGDVYFVDGLNAMWSGVTRHLPKGKIHLVSLDHSRYKFDAERNGTGEGITFNDQKDIGKIVEEALRQKSQ